MTGRPWGWAAAGVLALVLAVSSDTALAQSVTLDMGDRSGSTSGRVLQLVALMTVLSVAPSLLVMTTSFTRIVIVLHFVRQALGTQTSPPNMVISGMALFLTFFIMQPTLEKAYYDGIVPLIDGQIEENEAVERVARPFHSFMAHNVRPSDVQLFMDISKTPAVAAQADLPFKVLVPAFIISELRRAFEIGFLIYMPFIVIDMVIASVLMSMGMMMLPPVMMALPFKLIFFVLVDGWALLIGSLSQSFNP
ncbi:MAG: flagellar type III secretion system pore protein FliP [Alphaproteobacteria bacterium]|nr:flagellar type III secretion system pore protein FliP [Alphaproteobacteria bacterium]MBF0129549.1 flagellar type III secretion system pore protein FliP [Alphaproteobacteria bacterium]